MTFGEKVKKVRKEQGLSQRQLGERMGGITQQTVAQYEKAIEQPKLSTVRKLAEALDVTISELVVDWSNFSPDEVLNDMDTYRNDYENFNPRQVTNDNRLINNFHSLNYAGQEKAIEQVLLLTQIPRYQRNSSEE